MESHPSPDTPWSFSFHDDSTIAEAGTSSLGVASPVDSRGPRATDDDSDDDEDDAATDVGERIVAVRVARRVMPR